MMLRSLGDRAVAVTLGAEISPEGNARVTAFCCALEKARLPGVLEWVPSYAAVTVHYDPLTTDYETLCAALRSLETGAAARDAGALVVLPVCYGGEYGPDLAAVAAHCGLSEAEVIARHSGREYPVYLLGFMPGFPYLGGMDEALAAPRLKTPRTAIPAGSVGIAGKQTGVYPLVSPGGWQLIGRTPLRLFDVRRTPPTLLAAGMRVRFEPISAARFAELEAQHD